MRKTVHLSPSSVHERLRRLEREGAIKKWSLDVEYAALGLGVLAFIGIQASVPCSEMVDAVQAMPEVEECHSVAGDLSMLLKVRVNSTDKLLDVVDRLRQIPGVEQTNTTIVLKTQVDRPVALLTGKGPNPVKE
jgi:DNA-binding Lrp family transcriptional regulator